jgi:hypothetical protein
LLSIPRDIPGARARVVEYGSGVDVCALQVEKIEVIVVDAAISQCAVQFCAPARFVSLLDKK